MFGPALCAAIFLAGLIGSGQTLPVRPEVPPLDLEVTHATRLLVIAPHPDDEALGAAGLISRVRAKGGAVQVVLLTSGDGFPEAVEVSGGIVHPKPSDYRGFGVLREAETRAAMTGLGVLPSRIAYLGFPDEGLCRLASTYLYDKRSTFESPYTDRMRPPSTEQIVRGVKYRGVDVRREIERIVTEFAPTLVVLPHPEDDHPDHCSTHIFAREAFDAIRTPDTQRVRVLHYLVHYQQWPLTSDAGTGSLLKPPADFPPNEGRWVSLALKPEESAAKKRALLAYTSQTQVIGRFMLAFGRDNELFLEGEPEPLPACWCDGADVATELSSQNRRRP
jgi:LmbE family N-acetylglucosaminyl deacetylase